MYVKGMTGELKSVVVVEEVRLLFSGLASLDPYGSVCTPPNNALRRPTLAYHSGDFRMRMENQIVNVNKWKFLSSDGL